MPHNTNTAASTRHSDASLLVLEGEIWACDLTQPDVIDRLVGEIRNAAAKVEQANSRPERQRNAHAIELRGEALRIRQLHRDHDTLRHWLSLSGELKSDDAKTGLNVLGDQIWAALIRTLEDLGYTVLGKE